MKRKLIVTLVATALELYAAAATAQAAPPQCNLVGTAKTANGATPVRVGRMNPIDGFPETVTDSTGLTIQRCLDINYCFFDPIVPTDPFSLQIGSGGEAFYWSADSALSDSAGNVILKTTLAAETAFLGDNPLTGGPQDGTQFPFLRLRFVLNAPVDGVYTVVHPYGMAEFNVVGATGARDIFSTVDMGLSPGTTMTGPVGPFLVPDVSNAPANFLGDAALASSVNGSPCGTNFVQISAIGTDGNPVLFGGQPVLYSDLFVTQGMVFDGHGQTPLSADRLTYTRTAQGAGQIDAFASTTATAEVTVVDGPTILDAQKRILLPVTLDSTPVTAFDAVNSTSVFVADAAVLPPIVQMTATETVNGVDGLPVSDSTTLNLHLIDFVDIASADYDPASGNLSVTARSGDARTPPTLTLRDFGDFSAATKVVVTAAPPHVVHVDSSLGGSATAQVRVITATAPNAPTTLGITAITSTTLKVTWADTSTNENNFNIYEVPAVGTPTLIGTVGSNQTEFTVTGLQAATSHTYTVESENTVGKSPALTTVSATTLALPVAPSAVVAALGTATRTINVSWADNSLDETGFLIQRATAAAGPYTNLTTVSGVTSFVDSGGALLTGNAATYFYRVTAVRGPDSSTIAQSAGLPTPAAAQSVTGLAATSASTTRISLSWTNRAGATSNQIFRSVNGAAFAPLAAAGAAATTYNDDTVTAPNNYRYHVDATNWAGGTPSANTAALVPQAAANLVAPGNLQATRAARPALSWNDLSTGESNYRVTRTSYTVNATNGQSTIQAQPTTLTSAVAQNGSSFTDNGATADLAYLYRVMALSGATPGPASSVFTVAGTLPTANRPTATASLVGTAPSQTRRVTLSWATLSNVNVGGYLIERCAGVNCTNFATVAGPAVNTLGTVDGRNTASFQDNNLTANTSYTYRMRAVSGAGVTLPAGVSYPTSPVRTVVTN